uniref:Uncharacterized protein n=1 Tax=Oryza barthii TaxID=65489 RepID=A0A0D3H864_9ORYZ
MALVAVHARLAAAASSASPPLRSAASCTRLRALSTVTGTRLSIRHQQRRRWRRPRRAAAIAASLDLNEDNVRLAIDEAKAEASLSPPLLFFFPRLVPNWNLERHCC